MRDYLQRKAWWIGGALGIFIFLCVGIPPLLKSWQQSIVHSYIVALSSNWSIASIEESPTSVVLYQVHWSSQPPNAPLMLSARQIQIDSSISWLQWTMALEIKIDGLILQLDESDQALDRLFPKVSLWPFFLKPQVQLSVPQGELRIGQQASIAFELNGQDQIDHWQAQLSLTCDHCPLVWIERLGRKFKVWPEHSLYMTQVEFNGGVLEILEETVTVNNLKAKLQAQFSKAGLLRLQEGELAWESMEGEGLKAIGALQSGSVAFHQGDQEHLLFTADLKGDEWQLQSDDQNASSDSSNRFFFSISSQRLKSLLPSALAAYIPDSIYKGYLLLSTSPFDCVITMECPFPTSTRSDFPFLKGGWQWEYQSSANSIPKTKRPLGLWKLKTGQCLISLTDLPQPFHLSFHGLPLDLWTEGEVVIDYQHSDWQVHYSLQDLTADHPLFQLTLPSLAIAPVEAYQWISPSRDSLLFLPIRQASMTIKPLKLTVNDLRGDVWANEELCFFSDYEGSCPAFTFGGDALFHAGHKQQPAQLDLHISTLTGEISYLKSMLAEHYPNYVHLLEGVEGQFTAKDQGFNASFSFHPHRIEHTLSFIGTLYHGAYTQTDWALKEISTDFRLDTDAHTLVFDNFQSLFEHSYLSEPTLVVADTLKIPLDKETIGLIDLALFTQDNQPILDLSGRLTLEEEGMAIQAQARSSIQETLLPLMIHDVSLLLTPIGLKNCCGMVHLDLDSLSQMAPVFSFAALYPHVSSTDSIQLAWSYERLNDRLDVQVTSPQMMWNELKGPLQLQLIRQGGLWSLPQGAWGAVTGSADWLFYSDHIHFSFLELKWASDLHLMGQGSLYLNPFHLDLSIKRLSLASLPFSALLPNPFLSMEVTLNDQDHHWQGHGSWLGADQLSWRWSLDSFPEWSLKLYAPTESSPLAITLMPSLNSHWNMTKLKGRLPPFDLDLENVASASMPPVWKGDVRVIGSMNQPYLPDSVRQICQAWGIGKGWALSGEWGEACGFKGEVSGRDVHLMGQHLTYGQAKVRHTWPDIHLQQVELKDDTGSLYLDSLQLIPQSNQGWKIQIPHLLAKKLRFKYLTHISSPFQHLIPKGFFKSLDMHHIEGFLDQPNSWKAYGQCHFQVDKGAFLRHSFVQPLNIPGLAHPWESSLFLPVSGEIVFELDSGTLFLREFKKVYSQAKLSKLTLAPNAPSSFISANGDLSLHLGITREGWLRKGRETIWVNMTGTVESPTIQLQ